jgi:hypothetical protein
MVIDTRVAGLTVTVAAPWMPLRVAVIGVFPRLMPVTKLPSLKLPVALS